MNYIAVLKWIYRGVEEQKDGVYQAIMQRRDIRAQFIDEPVADELLINSFGLRIMPRQWVLCSRGIFWLFPGMPELEKAGWLPRLNLDELVFYEEWGKTGK